MALPTEYKKDLEYKKVSRSDALEARAEVEGNVTHIDGGILNYVRRQMHCEKVTPEVKRQAVAFEKEMSRMSGW